MGLCLMAFNWSDPIWIWNMLKVVIGLGMVIFVHELGHFLVAKLCGVKCEKFYLGFDIGGLKLFKFKWGETEYGIGILPLGGYVKMLGQEDNPARMREELERARLPQPASAEGGPAPTAEGASAQATTPERSAEPGPETRPVALDPRSFLAQSVPKRMAIISAGVVMNILFALLTGVWAFWIGVYEVACGVGAVSPGTPAWTAGLKPGDRITHVGGSPVERYKDLRVAVSVGDIEEGVSVVVERPGVAAPFTVTLHPQRTGPYPTIGILPPMSPVLNTQLPPVMPATTAGHAVPPFLPGDRIVAIDGEPVSDYSQLHRLMALKPDEPLQVTVDRKGPSDARAAAAPSAAPQRVTITVAPMPVRDLGMVMGMGKVTAVQQQSPAEKAGILPGDLITQVDGQPVSDPMRLPEQLRIRARKAAGQTSVTLTILRPGRAAPMEVRAELRLPEWYEIPRVPGNPMSAPALGIAYEVLNRVEAVRAGSPAAGAGIQPGDVIVEAKRVSPSDDAVRSLPYGQSYLDHDLNRELTADFQKYPDGWPAFFEAMQGLLPGGRVELTLADKGVVTLTPAEVEGWFHPERGFNFEPKLFFSGGQSFAVALRLGTRETLDAMTLVYRFLDKLRTQQVSPTALVGPIGIFKTAYAVASQGFADLLLFLTLIGANLAVVNFLPIPILDGGYMVFLAYEGVTGRPPGERVYVAMLYLGLLLILFLMIWALGLDVGLIPRG